MLGSRCGKSMLRRRASVANQARTSSCRCGATANPQWSAAPVPLPSTVQIDTPPGSRGCSRSRVRSSGTTASAAPSSARHTATSTRPARSRPSDSVQPSTQSGVAK
ncbi:hypothetical protein [Embleya scabrispora]|uniref:hypothetical protein n=1 Tax=Embleya scabrispora TaxID=159449 RepID=UPI001180E48C|nr:hypothetical protein [Embleya scabrispora]